MTQLAHFRKVQLKQKKMKLFIILVAQIFAQNNQLDEPEETGNLQYNPTVFPTITPEPPVDTGKNLVKLNVYT